MTIFTYKYIQMPTNTDEVKYLPIPAKRNPHEYQSMPTNAHKYPSMPINVLYPAIPTNTISSTLIPFYE